MFTSVFRVLETKIEAILKILALNSLCEPKANFMKNPFTRKKKKIGKKTRIYKHEIASGNIYIFSVLKRWFWAESYLSETGTSTETGI